MRTGSSRHKARKATTRPVGGSATGGCRLVLAGDLQCTEVQRTQLTGHAPCLPPCRTDKASKRTMTLSGPKAWTTKEVIELCEQMADTNATVRSHTGRGRGARGGGREAGMGIGCWGLGGTRGRESGQWHVAGGWVSGRGSVIERRRYANQVKQAARQRAMVHTGHLPTRQFLREWQAQRYHASWVQRIP